jgi:hypothetical protein
MTPRRALLVTALVLAPSLHAQQREVRGAPSDADVALRLWIPAGMVEVEGWDRDSIEIRATLASGVQLVGGGGGAAAKYAIEATRAGASTLPSAQVRLFVPRGARLWIKSTTAAVVVRGLHGELDVLQVGGNTVVADGSGVVTVESIDGRVEMRRINGTVRVRGGAGDVLLSDLSGGLDASTVSGLVNVTNRAVGGGLTAARIETVNGRIWWIGGLADGARAELTTHDGPVALMLEHAAPPHVVVHGAAPESRVEPRLLEPNAKTGRIEIRTFKGVVNASATGGI